MYVYFTYILKQIITRYVLDITEALDQLWYLD